MRLKIECTGRAENSDTKGDGVWSYVFNTILNEGEVPPKQSVQLKITSTEMLHYKRGQKYVINVDTDSGIVTLH